MVALLSAVVTTGKLVPVFCVATCPTAQRTSLGRHDGGALLIGAKKMILGAQKWLENDFDEPTAENIFLESNFFLKNVREGVRILKKQVFFNQKRE